LLCKKGTEKDILKYHLKYFGQPKIDGVRVMIVCKEGFVRIIGRSGADYSSKFPELVKGMRNLKGAFDGEIFCGSFKETERRVHLENKTKINYLSRKNPAVFYVFDWIDYANEEYFKRLLRLQHCVFPSCVRVVETTKDLVLLWEKVKKHNLEGIVIKNPNSKYLGFCKVRTWDWIKVKYVKSVDVKFTKYEINPAGVRLESDDGIAVQCSGSQHEAVLREIKRKGSVTCEIEYLEKTENGAYRQPVFKCLKRGI